MDGGINMKQFTLISILCCLLCIACEKEEKEPVYQGKWLFESAEPAVDEAYNGSYINIQPDRSFEIYDNSRALLIQGGSEHFNLSGKVLKLTDPETGEVYKFNVISRKQDKLTLSTTLMGVETRIVMRKVG